MTTGSMQWSMPMNDAGTQAPAAGTRPSGTYRPAEGRGQPAVSFWRGGQRGEPDPVPLQRRRRCSTSGRRFVGTALVECSGYGAKPGSPMARVGAAHPSGPGAAELADPLRTGAPAGAGATGATDLDPGCWWPVISVDCEKKELVGGYANGGSGGAMGPTRRVSASGARLPRSRGAQRYPLWTFIDLASAKRTGQAIPAPRYPTHTVAPPKRTVGALSLCLRKGRPRAGRERHRWHHLSHLACPPAPRALLVAAASSRISEPSRRRHGSHGLADLVSWSGYSDARAVGVASVQGSSRSLQRWNWDL